jgi:hypothetical protein
MKSNTQSITIDQDAASVFRFVAEPRNLPRWASTFAPRISPAGDDRWVVPSPAGEILIRFDADEDRRTVDFHMKPVVPTPGLEGVAVSRVVPNGIGAEYVFTMFQFAGMPEEVWHGQLEELPCELARLKRAIEAS